MNKLVSVVVPVYNVDGYLKKCLDSIVNQTYKNIEILLVDDGSTDESGAICDDYAYHDDRIVVIHKENGGISNARNAGISIARGYWIFFVDSDDWLDMDCIKYLVQIAEENDAEIAACDYVKAFDEREWGEKGTGECRIFSKKDALNNLYNSYYLIFYCVLGKLYLRELFDSINFPIGKNHEDEHLTYKIFFKSRIVAYTSEKMYYYRQRPGSFINSGFSAKNKLDLINAYELRAVFFEDNECIELRDKTYLVLLRIYTDIVDNIKYFHADFDKQLLLKKMNELKIAFRKSKWPIKFRIFYEVYCSYPFITHSIARKIRR